MGSRFTIFFVNVFSFCFKNLSEQTENEGVSIIISPKKDISICFSPKKHKHHDETKEDLPDIEEEDEIDINKKKDK